MNKFNGVPIRAIEFELLLNICLSLLILQPPCKLGLCR